MASASLVRSTILSALVLSCTTAIALAQTGSHPKQTQPHGGADPQLGSLIEAEQRALNGNEPAIVATTSRQLGAALLGELAKIQLLVGSSQDGVASYRDSLALKNSSDVRLELASALLRSGHALEAASEAALVTSAEPTNASAWAVRGSALRTSGTEPEAVEALTRALTLRSDVSVAYALGSTLLAIHDRTKADPIFRQIIKGSGGDPVWHVAVGDAYRETGYLSEAVEEFKAAIARDPRAAHAEFFLGLTYLQMNQWGPNSESFDHLRAATRISPHDYVSNFYLGALESTDGSDLPASDRHLRAAAEADSKQPEVWLYLGLNANRERDVTSAKRFLEKAIDLTGTEISRNNYQVRRAYFALGRILIAEGNRQDGDALLAKYKDAEKAAIAESGANIAETMGPAESSHAIETLRSVKPPDSTPTEAPGGASQLTPPQREQLRTTANELKKLLAGCLNDLGTAEARQQQYTQALVHFQQAEHYGPASPSLLHNLGVAAFRTSNFPEAARALTLYLAGTTGARDPHSQLMLAFSQFSLGNFSAAAKAFGAAGDDSMQDNRAAYSWAFSLARSGEQLEANNIASNLVKRDLPVDVLELVCHLYVDTEDFEQSASCYRKAYTLDPTASLAHYQVGEALIRLDRPAEAIPELRKQLELAPNDPNVESALAFALLQTSEKAEGEALLRKVTTEAPDQVDGQYQYGKLLLEKNDIAGAITHLQAAVSLDPDKDYIHYELQSAYRRAGQKEDAAREAALYRKIKDQHREAAMLRHDASTIQ